MEASSEKPTDETNRPQLSDTVLKILQEETSSEKEPGLLLIDMPTGTGKSYAAQHFIPKFLEDKRNKGRCLFYITGQKKNLPAQEEIIRAFQQAGYSRKKAEAATKENILWVRSVIDPIVENATTEKMSELHSRFKKGQWRTLVKSVQQFKEANENPAYASMRPAIEEHLRNNEREFRKFLIAELAAEKNENGKPLSPNEKRNLIRSDSEWKGVATLYPTALTRDYCVFIMSVNKFLVSNITLVENQFMFIDDKITENAAIIIDEFDASKGTLRTDITQRSAEGKVDIVSLIKQLYYTYTEGAFPEKVMRTTGETKTGNWIKDYTERNYDVLKGTFDDCNLKLNFKYECDPNTRNFIFFDHEYTTVSDNTFVVIPDEKEQINKVTSYKESKKKSWNNGSGKSLTEVFGKLRGSLHFTQDALSRIADNYQSVRMREKQVLSQPDYSRECAQLSILDHFNIKDAATQKFMMNGFRHSYKESKKTKTALIRGDFSVYEQGFHFICLENSDFCDFRTNMSILAIQDTPEKMMLRLCNRAIVIGMSATATFDSVLCNYNQDYLKRSLGSRYKALSSEAKNRMKQTFDLQKTAYDKVSINVELIGGNDNSMDTAWESFFGDPELGRNACACIEEYQKDKGGKKDYVKRRYLNICRAYRYFLEHDDIASMFCLTMPAPKEGGGVDTKIVSHLFQLLKGHNAADAPLLPLDVIAIPDSKQYDEIMESAKKRLEQGERIFVMASYSTLGTGVNAQYRVPPNGEVVTLYGENASGTEKDFDAIYLERPTNLAPYYMDDSYDEAIALDNLLRISELEEHLEISTSTYKRCCKTLLENFNNNKRTAKAWAKLSDLPSAKVSAAQKINQALGRISRTGIKNKTIHILADAKLAETMSLDAADDCLTNPEYDALVAKLKQFSNQSEDHFQRHWEDGAALNSNRMNAKIRTIISYQDWNDANREFWRELRKYTLQYPTASDTNVPLLVKNAYAQLPTPACSYTYEEKGDYGKVKISFDSVGNTLSKSVSERAASLPQLMRIPGVKEHFESNGWATTWESSHAIMTPVLFNNIYKGALGEAVGKFVLEEKIKGLELCDIDERDKFEKFDYRVGHSDIYVDFKHWSGVKFVEAGEELQKIEKKMEAIGASRALIINILGKASEGYDTSYYKHGEILTVPYLFDTDKEAFEMSFISQIDGFIKQGGVL